MRVIGDPFDVEERYDILLKPANSFDPEPVLDEGETLDEDIFKSIS